jgi:uncharacterized membrane protein
MSRTLALRALDTLTAVLLALVAWALLIDGFTVSLGGGGGAILRAQDVLLVMLGVVAARWTLALPRVSVRHPTRVVVVGMIAYALVFSVITVGQHRTFRTHAMDLGYYVQVLWDLGHGLPPYETLLQQHAWAGHLSPILYLLAPLGRLPDVPEGLLVFQSVALALGALPLYRLARRRVGDVAGAGLACLYLLNPSLHGINTKDFHTAALAIPLLLTAMDALGRGHVRLFWAATILTLTTREDAAIAVLGLGLWTALAQARLVLGPLVGVLALAWLFASVEWIVPVFRGGAYPYLTARYHHLGENLGAIVLSPLLRPRAVLEVLLSAQRLRYLGALLVPLGFLPLAAPLAAVGALPALAQNLLNSDPVLFNYRTQYQSFVLPFLLVASVDGLERLVAGGAGKVLTARRVLAVAVLASLALSARTVNGLALTRWRAGEGARAAGRLMATIPATASVTTEERFFPHLAQRARVFVFPRGLDESDYVFVNGARLDGGEIGRLPAAREGSTVVLAPAGAGGPRHYRFRIVGEEAGFLLLRPAPDQP